MREDSLSYFKKADDKPKKSDDKPKKSDDKAKKIDLTKARGIRKRSECKIEDWPVGNPELCFGLALPKRTWYFYGLDDKDVK